MTQSSERERPRDVATLGVGVLGYGFMGKAHCNAFKTLPYVAWPPQAQTRLVAICGRSRSGVSDARERYGFERGVTDWRELVSDPEIDILDNLAPNDLHAEPCIEGAGQGKHILCEKPLARNSAEARAMLEAVVAAGVVHMTGFNSRFIPALRLAYDLIQGGRLGRIFHFRGWYLKGSGTDESAPLRWRHRSEVAGWGTLGDLGSHTIDLARWLVGEVGSVSALTRTFIPERPVRAGGNERQPVTVDDAAVSLLEFENGAIGTLEATRLAPGWKNYHAVEVNGSRGSVRFNLERLNELQFVTFDDPPELQGWRDVLVTEGNHPFYRFWWPPGHVIGWEHSFIHQIDHFLRAVTAGASIAPYGATFEDGYRNALIADAMVQASQVGRRIYLDERM